MNWWQALWLLLLCWTLASFTSSMIKDHEFHAKVNFVFMAIFCLALV